MVSNFFMAVDPQLTNSDMVCAGTYYLDDYEDETSAFMYFVDSKTSSVLWRIKMSEEWSSFEAVTF